MSAVHLHYDRRPKVLGAMIKFVVVPRKGFKPDQGLPDIQAHWSGAHVDSKALNNYLLALDIQPSKYLPVMYPHVLANGMHMHMLAHNAFPFSAMGVLHLKNRVIQHKPIPVNAIMDIHTYMGDVRLIEKGMEFDLITDVMVDNEKVWEENSTYFAAGRFGGNERPSETSSFELESLQTVETIKPWNVPKNRGRVYAKLTGDHNPIHTSKIAAKLFGLKRDIAHGTGLLAQAIEHAKVMERDIHRPWQVDVVFKGPVYLGSDVQLKAEPNSDSGRFDLYSEQNPKPNFCVSITPV